VTGKRFKHCSTLFMIICRVKNFFMFFTV